MLVYRLSQSRYANDVSGEGARLFGGRWNLPMIPCLYASESRALALLEYSVHVSVHEIRRALCFITYEIDEKKIYNPEIHELPGNWRDSQVPQHTQEYGTRLLTYKKAVVIKIPSTIISSEYNYLINPHYYENLQIVEVEDYSYDLRLKTK